MRLWHQSLLPHLPRQQLLGQHREICALRGNGWGKKHSVVNYVFDHSYRRLYAYHCFVMNEMEKRGYRPGEEWLEFSYRGKTLGRNTPIPSLDIEEETLPTALYRMFVKGDELVYPEHDEVYLKECLENLKGKGIIIKIKKRKE